MTVCHSVKFKHDDRSHGGALAIILSQLFMRTAEGNIWVGTDVGLYIYYPEKDSFRHFAELSAEEHEDRAHCDCDLRETTKGCVCGSGRVAGTILL